MDEGGEKVELAELLNTAIESHLIDLHVGIPARIDSYDPTKQTVVCTPQLNRALPDGRDNYVPEKLPQLTDVPVCFPRCQAFSITFPLVAGDFVFLVFAERNIGTWRATGNQGDPGDLGMHTLDGAVAIPGLYPDGLPATASDSTKMRVGSDTDPNGRIEFTATEVHIGQGATKGIARNGDAVKVTIPAHAVDGTNPVSDLDVTGTITNGSAHGKCVD